MLLRNIPYSGMKSRLKERSVFGLKNFLKIKGFETFTWSSNKLFFFFFNLRYILLYLFRRKKIFTLLLNKLFIFRIRQFSFSIQIFNRKLIQAQHKYQYYATSWRQRRCILSRWHDLHKHNRDRKVTLNFYPRWLSLRESDQLKKLMIVNVILQDLWQ